MDQTLRAPVVTTLKKLDAQVENIDKATQATRQELEATARRYAKERSSVLAGIIGGALGSIGGIGISTVSVGAFTVGGAVLTGPIGLAVGAALAVLSWRGTAYLKLERAKERLELAVGTIKAEIQSLPPDAPKETRDRLWDGYNELMTDFILLSRRLQVVDDRPALASAAESPQITNEVPLALPKIGSSSTPAGSSDEKKS